MPTGRGGARNRGGPAPDPRSGASERKGLAASLTTLPSEGRTEEPPEYPTPPHPADQEGGLFARELVIWAELWRTPQAVAWAEQSWRWHTLAELCRVKAMAESGDSAALYAQLHRYRDQLGLTPAGLLESGWRIATDELAERAVDHSATVSRPRRLRAASGEA